MQTFRDNHHFDTLINNRSTQLREATSYDIAVIVDGIPTEQTEPVVLQPQPAKRRINKRHSHYSQNYPLRIHQRFACRKCVNETMHDSCVFLVARSVNLLSRVVQKTACLGERKANCRFRSANVSEINYGR